MFIAKFANSTGAVQWAQTSTGTGNNGAGGLTVDTNKFVVLDGTFYNSFGLPGTQTLTATGGEGNIFLAKLDTVPTLYIVPQLDSNYCAGGTYIVPYTVSDTFNNGNTFMAQLSDSTGSFVNEQNIGSTNSSTSGAISITIPANATGSNYLIRIVSSNPAASSYVNGCGAYYQQNVYIDNFYIKIGNNISVAITADTTTICSGGSVQLTATDIGVTYKWTSNGDTTALASTDTIIVNPATTTTYYVTVSNGYCTGEDSVIVNTNSAPPLIISPNDTLFCNGQSATLHVTNGGTGFIWTPTEGLSDSTLSGDSILASPTVSTTYTVTGMSSGGCAATGTTIVTVIPSPNTPTFTQDKDTLISSSTYDNQWYYNGNPLTNDTSRELIITTPGEYWVDVTNEANGCSTPSDSMFVDTVSGIAQITLRNDIQIYPNPFNNNIFIQINSSAQNITSWTMQITDVLGRTLYNRLSLNYSNDIDLSNLPGGVYFITITNNTTRAVFPVVKQN